ncbi:hypothetical protein MKW98_023181 [Papaver atlanticum]|uniref:Uncharacterized protein n=1 Tax=Papaver atlanticum TaxID=357466 RepID=A0AAD4SMN3_9MAGN|nr:hypothetical protein MKW98_023181 [Papaver atlanticum]
MGCLNPVLLSWCSCLLTRRMDSSKGSVLSSLHVLKMLELLQSLNGQIDIAGRIIKGGRNSGFSKLIAVSGCRASNPRSRRRRSKVVELHC